MDFENTAIKQRFCKVAMLAVVVDMSYVAVIKHGLMGLHPLKKAAFTAENWGQDQWLSYYEMISPEGGRSLRC